MAGMKRISEDVKHCISSGYYHVSITRITGSDSLFKTFDNVNILWLIRLMSTWRNVLQDKVYKVFVCALSFNNAQDNLLLVKDSPEANSSCP